MLRWIARQYRKVGMIAAVGSIILLMLNLSVSIYDLVEWRGIHPYLTITLFFLIGLICIWGFALLYVNVLKMNKYEKMADSSLNPINVNVLTPFQIMWWRTISRALLSGDKSEQRQSMEKIDRWTKLGYIPVNDIPDDLKRYCIFGRDERL